MPFRVKMKDGSTWIADHSTIAQSPEIAAAIVKEKEAEGFRVVKRMHGSDSKRGTKPYFQILWGRQNR